MEINPANALLDTFFNEVKIKYHEYTREGYILASELRSTKTLMEFLRKRSSDIGQTSDN